MAKVKKISEKTTAAEAESDQANAEEIGTQTSELETEKKLQPLTTGLEDYGRWRTLYQNYQPPKDEKPFRRGRIWC